MPELPEVETIARGLSRAVVGKTIDEAKVFLPKVVLPDPATFRAGVAGEHICTVGRRGKFVVFTFASGTRVAVHLRMTGRLLIRRADDNGTYPYENVRWLFSDGSLLSFADIRQFGRMRLIEPGQPWDEILGLEPLSRRFTRDRFSELLQGRTTPIKAFLLDQRRIAGIGNIYACEALWEARIRPTRAAGSLSRERRERLHAALQSVLRRAITMGGTSVDDYVNADGERGGFQNELSIYGQDGEACPRCSAAIVRTVIAQRRTWWCRSCQRS